MITIIVLIILAAVTIIAVKETNLVRIATKGTENYSEAQVNESQKLDELVIYIEEAVSNITSLGQVTGEIPTTPEGPDKPEEPQLPTGWDAKKVYKVTSADNKTVPVPKGFTPSKVAGEKSVDGGFVIKQDGTQNEFVWIPVDKETFGQLYEFSGEEAKPIEYPTTRYREPDVLTNTVTGDASTEDGRGIDQLKRVVGITGSSNNDIMNKWKEQLEKEYNDMKRSVTTYGGFYIGRYETGDLSKEKAVVAKGNEDISNQNWYVQYQTSKTITQGTDISSSMIWGCQWDAVMKWFLSYEDTKGYVIDSTGKGNHAGTQEGENKRIATGSNPSYSVKNIYDMAGNVYDWTIEADDTFGRVIRRKRLQQLQSCV